VSNYPEDILFVVNVEMDVARGSLSKGNQMEVMIDILLEFKASIINMRRALSAEWEGIEIARLCSVINDSATMMDYVEKYSIFGDTEEHVVIPTIELNAVRDDVIKGYREVSLEATDLVAYSIMNDVQEPVMDKVFTAEWEKNGELMNCVAATLRDYYNDLIDWLPQYEYCGVVKKCIDVLVEKYISAAFAKKHKGRRFFDADAVPARLIQDRLILLDFFSKVECEMEGNAARQHANESLHVFLVLSNIIDAADPKDVADEINTLCELLGTKYSQAVIMHVQARKTGPHNHEAYERWDEGLNTIIKKENEQCRLDVDLDHVLEVKKTPSLPDSYSGSAARCRCVLDSTLDLLDKVITVSAEGCCWALDTGLELHNGLRRHIFDMKGEPESTNDVKCYHETSMSAATKDASDATDGSNEGESEEHEESKEGNDASAVATAEKAEPQKSETTSDATVGSNEGENEEHEESKEGNDASAVATAEKAEPQKSETKSLRTRSIIFMNILPKKGDLGCSLVDGFNGPYVSSVPESTSYDLRFGDIIVGINGRDVRKFKARQVIDQIAIISNKGRKKVNIAVKRYKSV